MTPELPPNPRAELETKVTALLLGELSAEEAASMRDRLDKDPELRRLRDQLALTLGLLRETVGETKPLRLSAGRREQMLASFKTIAPKEFAKQPSQQISILIPIAAAIVLLGLLAGLLLPALSKAKFKGIREQQNVATLDMRPSLFQPLPAPVIAAPTPAVSSQIILPQNESAPIASYSGQNKNRNGEYDNSLQNTDGRSRFQNNLKDVAGNRNLTTDTEKTKSAQKKLSLATRVAESISSGELAWGNVSQPRAGKFTGIGGGAPVATAAGNVSPTEEFSNPGAVAQASTPVNEDSLQPQSRSALETPPAIHAGERMMRRLDKVPTPGSEGVAVASSADAVTTTDFGVATATPPPVSMPAAAAPSAPGAASPADRPNSEKTAPRIAEDQPLAKWAQLPPPIGRNAISQGNVAAEIPSSNNRVVTYASASDISEALASIDKANIHGMKLESDRKDTAKAPAMPATPPLAWSPQNANANPAGTSVNPGSHYLFNAGKQDGFIIDDVPLAHPVLAAPIPQPEVFTRSNAFTTFSLNVSDVAFKLAAASLENGVMPQAASMRSEEFINAFDYRDPEPAPGAPLGFAWERSGDPFAQNRDFLRFSIKTAAQGREAGRPLNLVLLLDKSGSMERADRVEIIANALRVLASQLQANDTLSVVVFARTARLFVDGVPGNQAGDVAKKLRDLTPEGGTNLEEAMRLAYETALRHYLANGENRVVLLTDGAANLGNVEPAALKQKVESNRKQGIALDCFGVGWDGYNDDLLETLSRAGNGRYGFINTPEEAATEFAGKLAGALRVAAADVKVQVEFNPSRVTSYRQIGYAKDQLKKEDFRDNNVKAAQIGAAESGNALYTVEINRAGEGPLCTVHVRFRVPGTSDYQEHEWTVPYTGSAVALEKSSAAMRLAATAAEFSEWLAGSPYAGEVTPDRLLTYLRGAPETYGADTRPKKLEWMIRQAKSISGK